MYPKLLDGEEEFDDEGEPMPQTGLREISGWAVVGMTTDGFKDKTDEVLSEL